MNSAKNSPRTKTFRFNTMENEEMHSVKKPSSLKKLMTEVSERELSPFIYNDRFKSHSKRKKLLSPIKQCMEEFI